jgi:hypothetical protein
MSNRHHSLAQLAEHKEHRKHCQAGDCCTLLEWRVLKASQIQRRILDNVAIALAMSKASKEEVCE